MKRKWFLALFLFIGLVALVSAVGVAAVNGYTLDWWTADGGGGNSTNGGYAVHGSIGQPDAGQLSGGAYGLQGGFWAGAGIGPSTSQIYLPLVIR